MRRGEVGPPNERRVGAGSPSHTSSTAAPKRPVSTARRSATPSTTSPRAALTSHAPRRSAANSAEPMRWCVGCGPVRVSGVWSVRRSDAASASPSGTNGWTSPRPRRGGSPRDAESERLGPRDQPPPHLSHPDDTERLPRAVPPHARRPGPGATPTRTRPPTQRLSLAPRPSRSRHPPAKAERGGPSPPSPCRRSGRACPPAAPRPRASRSARSGRRPIQLAAGDGVAGQGTYRAVPPERLAGEGDVLVDEEAACAGRGVWRAPGHRLGVYKIERPCPRCCASRRLLRGPRRRFHVGFIATTRPGR